MKKKARLITWLSMIWALSSWCAWNSIQSKTWELIDSSSSKVNSTLKQKCVQDYNSWITNCFDIQKPQNNSFITPTKNIDSEKNAEQKNIKEREEYFEMIGNYMWLADSIIQVKTTDINALNINSEIKTKKIEEFEKEIRISEQTIIKEIFLKRKKTGIYLPLTQENIRTIEPIMNSIKVLWTSRYEHNTELVHEIEPIILSEIPSENYYLYILIDEDKFNNKIIKSLRITKWI